MELIGFILIYCFYCFLIILDAGSAPTCIVYHNTNEVIS